MPITGTGERCVRLPRYLLDDNDHIVKRYDFDAENDTADLEIARQYVDGHDVEVWQRQSFVRRLTHEK